MQRHIKTAADIRRRREELGLTMEDAAHYLDVSLITLSRWERGLVNPSKIVLSGIGALFAEYKQPKERKE